MESGLPSRLKRGGGQNARATGGPGILPVTKGSHWLFRLNTNDFHLPGAGQDVRPFHRRGAGLFHPCIPLSNIPLSLFLCVFLGVLCTSAFHFIGFTLARNWLEARFS